MALLKLDTYPVIGLKKSIVFPSATIPIIFEGKEAIDTLNQAIGRNNLIVLSFSDGKRDISIGVICRVLQYWYLSPQVMGVTLEGLRRVKILNIREENFLKRAEVLEISNQYALDDPAMNALARSVFHQFNELLKIEGVLTPASFNELNEDNLPPERLADVVASTLTMNLQEKIELLEVVDVKKRLELLNQKLAKELSVVRTEAKIQKSVTDSVGKVEKEFVLREQLKAIEKELGLYEENEQYAELESKISQAGMPPAIEKRALKELQRLRRMQSQSAETPYIWTYLETISDLPWKDKTEDIIDLKKAKAILDQDHYGLEKVKDRILEHLAVQKLTNRTGRGTILCFVGPPGTGKTSVGQSIAKALGRKFIRISLGGIHDESEIRGHRRTYVGALPGRIIQGLRTAGTKNPVFMMDEVDKIGSDYRGDPAAALLEVLDPAQNNSFSDNYLEVPFDLSDIFFITTANMLETIPPALRDRMEVIEFSGYTPEEKINIAKKFLIPNQLKASGLATNVKFDDLAIRKIITKYTREAGVRDLERKFAQIIRQLARQFLEKNRSQIKITAVDLVKYLGPEQFSSTMKEEKDEVGVSTALAWTPTGGEIIFVETSVVPGHHNLVLTGQLGQVMQESARAALTYVRSRADQYRFDPTFFLNSDIHVHVPAGSIPKDGSSAGVAIAVALASALTKRKIKKEVAFTGEITLVGKVMEVAGIKEKVLAAYRAGVETVVLPKENKKNLGDVPKEAREKLNFKFVSTADEAINLALM